MTESIITALLLTDDDLDFVISRYRLAEATHFEYRDNHFVIALMPVEGRKDLLIDINSGMDNAPEFVPVTLAYSKLLNSAAKSENLTDSRNNVQSLFSLGSYKAADSAAPKRSSSLFSGGASGASRVKPGPHVRETEAVQLRNILNGSD